MEAHYERIGVNAEVSFGEYPGLYRTRFIRDYDPLISIIIPNKDHIADLKRCMDSIDEKSTYRNYEYVIVENNSTREETFAFYRELETGAPMCAWCAGKGNLIILPLTISGKRRPRENTCCF